MQYSVFECRLEAAQIERLERAGGEAHRRQEGCVKTLAVRQECAGGRSYSTAGKVTEDPEVYVL
jgi:CRISPR/Cas system-associated endoribonuclease Cas2